MLETQVFLACMYVPILIYWGIAWPVISIISTPFFTPLFVFFLSISSLIFLNVLFLGTVFSFLVIILEYTTKVWLFFLQSSFFCYQIAFCLPPLFILMIVPICALLILHTFNNRVIRIVCLFATLVCLHGVSTIIKLLKPAHQLIITDKGVFHAIHYNQTTLIIDSGGWKKQVPYTSWYSYTVMPQIIKQCGISFVDAWIVLSPKNNIVRFVDSLQIIMPRSLLITVDYNYNQIPQFYPFGIKKIVFGELIHINDLEIIITKQSIVCMSGQKEIARISIT